MKLCRKLACLWDLPITGQTSKTSNFQKRWQMLYRSWRDAIASWPTFSLNRKKEKDSFLQTDDLDASVNLMDAVDVDQQRCDLLHVFGIGQCTAVHRAKIWYLSY